MSKTLAAMFEILSS